MPLAGTGMLLTSMDIDPSDEADFNRWYDREHLIERVAIDGFLEARRYIADQASPKYLCLYSTATFDVLDSPPYRAALKNPTDWSKTNLARFKRPHQIKFVDALPRNATGKIHKPTLRKNFGAVCAVDTARALHASQ